jgi:tetratricopeptide (TPR) repeat protein
MSKRWKKTKQRRPGPGGGAAPAVAPDEADGLYGRAGQLAQAGDHGRARELYEAVLAASPRPRQRALAQSNLAALAAAGGDRAAARAGFRAALEIDPGCEPARANLALLEADGGPPRTEVREAPPAGAVIREAPAAPVKVALVGFLFNWPSTGGGIVHTAELARFLAKAGYEVRKAADPMTPIAVG